MGNERIKAVKAGTMALAGLPPAYRQAVEETLKGETK